jgi:hypothetical protein
MQDDRFGGTVERVLEGLLYGSLGSEWEDVDEEKGSGKGEQRAKSQEYKRGAFGYGVTARRNVFDNEELDITGDMMLGEYAFVLSHFLSLCINSTLNFPDPTSSKDSSTIERMKRYILRRVEEMEEGEAELFEQEGNQKQQTMCTMKSRSESG